MTGFAVFFRPGTRALAAVLGVTMALAACSHEEEDKYVERPVGKLYNAGMAALAEHNYKEAAKQFDEVERQHPYSIWATKAELMSAYAHYQGNEYQETINALNRFIQLHPGNRDIAYAYYLKALSYYEQVTDVERDQSNAEQAMASLEELIRRFPDSRYARDARQKIDLVRNHLAGKEMQVGRYYQKREDYLAAINRFRVVTDKYQTTAQVPEALERLVECYTALGLTQEARKTAVILGYNYPRSEWYADSYELVQKLEAQGGKEINPAPKPLAQENGTPSSAEPASLQSSPPLAPPSGVDGGAQPGAEGAAAANPASAPAAQPDAGNAAAAIPASAPAAQSNADNAAGAANPASTPAAQPDAGNAAAANPASAPAAQPDAGDAAAANPASAPAAQPNAGDAAAANPASAPAAQPNADNAAAANPASGPAAQRSAGSSATGNAATGAGAQAAPATTAQDNPPPADNKPKETTAEVGRGPVGFFSKAWNAIF